MSLPAPEECNSKDDVRAEIDRLDRELVARLGERFAYVRRMAELKHNPSDADDRDRVDDVLAKVAAEADAVGLDRDLALSLWRRLIEWNIAWERLSIGTDGGR